MAMIGLRSRFAFVIPERPGASPVGPRQVDIYAAGRWLTCDDSNAFLPHFTDCLMRAVEDLLQDDAPERYRRLYPALSPAENHRMQLDETNSRNNNRYLHYNFMTNWGPTTDNGRASLFLTEGVASIACSFWRPQHHDPSELGDVFVAELPERELMRILLQAARLLATGA